MKSHPGQIVVTEPTENVWNYENTWATGLCDCSNVKICCAAYCCLPCFACSLFKRTDEFLCTPFFLPVTMLAFRGKLRTAFRIKGSICGDFFTTMCCPMCSALQMYHELETQGL